MKMFRYYFKKNKAIHDSWLSLVGAPQEYNPPQKIQIERLKTQNPAIKEPGWDQLPPVVAPSLLGQPWGQARTTWGPMRQKHKQSAYDFPNRLIIVPHCVGLPCQCLNWTKAPKVPACQETTQPHKVVPYENHLGPSALTGPLRDPCCTGILLGQKVGVMQEAGVYRA